MCHAIPRQLGIHYKYVQHWVGAGYTKIEISNGNYWAGDVNLNSIKKELQLFHTNQCAMQNIKVRHRKIFLYAFLVERIFCLLLVQLGPNYWCFIHPTWREFLRTDSFISCSQPTSAPVLQAGTIYTSAVVKDYPKHVIHSRPEWRSW